MILPLSPPSNGENLKIKQDRQWAKCACQPIAAPLPHNISGMRMVSGNFTQNPSPSPQSAPGWTDSTPYSWFRSVLFFCFNFCNKKWVHVKLNGNWHFMNHIKFNMYMYTKLNKTSAAYELVVSLFFSFILRGPHTHFYCRCTHECIYLIYTGPSLGFIKISKQNIFAVCSL